MIISGWRRYNLDSRNPKRINCRNCNSIGSITIFVDSLYLHIWRIPFCAIGKKGFSSCSNCDEILKPKKMPHNLKIEYQNFKNKLKTPLWQYFGLFISLIIISWFVVQIKKDEDNELKYIDDPKLGDTYEYQINDNLYSSLKIIDIKSDSIYFHKNYLSKKRKHKVFLIDKEINYSDSIVRYSKNDVQMMFSENIIFGINRK